nr:MAG TPA: hypothetical protein [Caudoviricetes sp.]
MNNCISLSIRIKSIRLSIVYQLVYRISTNSLSV